MAQSLSDIPFPEFPDEIGDPDIDALFADGWQYRDMEKMRPEFWLYLMDIIGPDNVKLLTFARYQHKKHGRSVRGQLMISPAGLSNLGKERDAGYPNMPQLPKDGDER